MLGVSCGIDYNPAPGVGIDAFGWTECADTGQIFAGPNGTWPQAGGGMRAIWSQSGCQRTTVPGYEHEGGHAVAGAIYVVAYGADRMDITYNLAAPVPEFDVVDCVGLGSVLPPSAAGTASFATLGGTPGCNPCLEPCAEDPVCEITATEIDFGEVWPKSFTERRIGIRNLGPGAMLGTAQTEGCALIPVLPEFRVVGRSRYLLQPGEPRNFLVRFRPVLPGYYTCVLDMGPLCPDVTLTGYGIGHLPSRRTTWGAIKGGAWGDKP